jgi:hypothetical protein
MSDYTLNVQPVAVPKATAAAMLGMSTDSFERYAMSSLPVIRRGRLRLYPVKALEAWAADSAQRDLEAA